MKKYGLIGLLTVAVVAPVLAQTPKQPGPGGPRDPQVRLERIAERLGLTEDQRQRMGRLMEKHSTEARAIRENEALSPEQRRDQLSTLRQQHRAEVSSILTPEQRAQWEAARERLREGRPERAERKGLPKGRRPSDAS